MMQQRICREAVNNGTTARFFRFFHEVGTSDGMNLIMSHKVPADRKPLAPVMLVHGLGQNRHTWTLSGRSLENYLVSRGFETFNVELRGHGLSRANGSGYPDRFETYLEYDMPALFDAIRAITGGRKLFYMGHSLGGTISYCIGHRFRDDLAGILSIAGPFNMARGNFLLRSIARAGVSLGRVNPLRRIQPRAFYIDYIGFVARYGLFLLDNSMNKLPVHVWYPGSMEPDILRERVEKGFDRTSFNVVKYMFQWGARGRFLSSDESVDFEEAIAGLTTPILFVNGDRDYAVPCSAVSAAYRKAGSADKTFKVFRAEKPGCHWGHIDLIFGRQAPDIVWPYMLDWMLERLPEQGHA